MHGATMRFIIMLVFVVLKYPDSNLKYNKIAYRRDTQYRTCIRPVATRTLEQYFVHRSVSTSLCLVKSNYMFERYLIAENLRNLRYAA